MKECGKPARFRGRPYAPGHAAGGRLGWLRRGLSRPGGRTSRSVDCSGSRVGFFCRSDRISYRSDRNVCQPTCISCHCFRSGRQADGCPRCLSRSSGRVKKQAFSCFGARLSLSLLREDRLRLGQSKKKAWLSFALALAFHYLCFAKTGCGSANPRRKRGFLLLWRSPFTIFDERKTTVRHL